MKTRSTKALLFLCSLFALTLSSWAQELALLGHVQDAKTGESLPYATIYRSTGKGTLTNIEGDFSLRASAQDELTFSYVGYEKLRMKASEVPKVVIMKPFERTLKEVVVAPVDEKEVLKKVIKNLKKDFLKHQNERQGYFMRTLMKNRKDSYLIESFIAALSAVNLREEEMLSGIKGRNAEGNESRMGLGFTNIQHLTEIAPSTYQNEYWQQAIKPLSSYSETKEYYNVQLETLFGSEDEKLYRIVFQWNEKKRPEWHTRYLENRRHLTGTAYVDAKALRLLSFEGEVGNAYLLFNFQRQPNAIKFYITYDYTNGYAAVSTLVVDGGNEGMRYRLLLFNVKDDSLFAVSSGFIEDNILSAVDNAGYDSTLWDKYNIVKRTEEEELAASKRPFKYEKSNDEQ